MSHYVEYSGGIEKKNLNPLAVLYKWNHVWSVSRDPHRKVDIYTFALIFFRCLLRIKNVK